jgi:hypothetical protein
MRDSISRRRRRRRKAEGHLGVQRDGLPPELVEALASDDVARHHHKRREQPLPRVHVAHHLRRRPQRPRGTGPRRHRHGQSRAVIAGHGAGPRGQSSDPGSRSCEGHSGGSHVGQCKVLERRGNGLGSSAAEKKPSKQLEIGSRQVAVV